MSHQLESDSLGRKREAIDALISPLLTKYTQIGVVVGILERTQTAIFGYGKVGETRPMVPDETTLFEIGSITKVFTQSGVSHVELGLSHPGRSGHASFHAGLRLPSIVQVLKFALIVCAPSIVPPLAFAPCFISAVHHR